MWEEALAALNARHVEITANPILLLMKQQAALVEETAVLERDMHAASNRVRKVRRRNVKTRPGLGKTGKSAARRRDEQEANGEIVYDEVINELEEDVCRKDAAKAANAEKKRKRAAAVAAAAHIAGDDEDGDSDDVAPIRLKGFRRRVDEDEDDEVEDDEDEDGKEEEEDEEEEEEENGEEGMEVLAEEAEFWLPAETTISRDLWFAYAYHMKAGKVNNTAGQEAKRKLLDAIAELLDQVAYGSEHGDEMASYQKKKIMWRSIKDNVDLAIEHNNSDYSINLLNEAKGQVLSGRPVAGKRGGRGH